jgi:signal transduction histidine kinase
MRSSVLFWYYFIILLIVVSALLFGDYSGINPSSRLLLGLFLVLLLLSPVIFIWSSKEGSFGEGSNASYRELEDKVATLERDNEKLKAADHAKSEFLSRTTHQLRTPLSAIKWTFHMIMNGDMGAVTPDQQMFLKKGYEAAERVINVINDWLSLDYVEANRTKYQIVPVNLPEVIDSVVFEFNQRLAEKQQQLTVNRPSGQLPLIPLDPIKFGMVMENLLDNAVKYTPQNGRITITIIGDRLTGPIPELEVTVADTGIGIPAAEQSKLFKQFARASNAVALAPRGSGLGLYIVKDIVEGQGGKIWFESEEGKGTTFHITIPVTPNQV